MKRTLAAASSLILATATLSLLALSPATASTSTCAEGGACVVGDIGPGGGTVFYVSATEFACGSDFALTQRCNYLEAAGSEWTDTASNFPWSPEDTATNVTGLTDTSSALDPVNAIGSGLAATNVIVAAYGAGTGYAAGAARAFVNTAGTPQSDWYLPAGLELLQLCKYANSQAQGADTDACQPGTYRSGFSPGNSNGVYWSSSERNTNEAWFEYFDIGGLDVVPKTGNLAQNRVRPIRAGLGVANSVDDVASQTGAGALPDTGQNGVSVALWASGAVSVLIIGGVVLLVSTRRASRRK